MSVDQESWCQSICHWLSRLENLFHELSCCTTCAQEFFRSQVFTSLAGIVFHLVLGSYLLLGLELAYVLTAFRSEHARNQLIISDSKLSRQPHVILMHTGCSHRPQHKWLQVKNQVDPGSLLLTRHPSGLCVDCSNCRHLKVTCFSSTVFAFDTCGASARRASLIHPTHQTISLRLKNTENASPTSGLSRTISGSQEAGLRLMLLILRYLKDCTHDLRLPFMRNLRYAGFGPVSLCICSLIWSTSRSIRKELISYWNGIKAVTEQRRINTFLSFFVLLTEYSEYQYLQHTKTALRLFQVATWRAQTPVRCATSIPLDRQLTIPTKTSATLLLLTTLLKRKLLQMWIRAIMATDKADSQMPSTSLSASMLLAQILQSLAMFDKLILKRENLSHQLRSFRSKFSDQITSHEYGWVMETLLKIRIKPPSKAAFFNSLCGTLHLCPLHTTEHETMDSTINQKSLQMPSLLEFSCSTQILHSREAKTIRISETASAKLSHFKLAVERLAGKLRQPSSLHMCTNRYAGHPCNDSAPQGNATPLPSNQEQQSSINPSKRKFSNCNGNDYEDEDGGISRSKRPKYEQSLNGSDNHAGRELACHYYKYDPVNHKECGRNGYKTIDRLKQHLEKRHRVHRCQQCKQLFHDETQLSLHYRIEDFFHDTTDQVDYSHGYDEQQAKQIKQRDRGVAPESKWMRIWKVLFPGHVGVIPHPWMETLESTLEEFESFHLRNLSTMEAEFNNLIAQGLPAFEACLRVSNRSSVQSRAEFLQGRDSVRVSTSNDNSASSNQSPAILEQQPETQSSQATIQQPATDDNHVVLEDLSSSIQDPDFNFPMHNVNSVFTSSGPMQGLDSDVFFNWTSQS